jgi:predicted RNA-binding protein with PUA-like domain
MLKSYWIVKSEPEAYSWADLVRDKTTDWTGVRNYSARLSLSSMKCGDSVLFYESVTTKAIVGVASVDRTAFADTTTAETGWVAVGLRHERSLKNAVSLLQLKADKELSNLRLIRQSRLSVMGISMDEFHRILAMSENPSDSI